MFRSKSSRRGFAGALLAGVFALTVARAAGPPDNEIVDPGRIAPFQLREPLAIEGSHEMVWMLFIDGLRDDIFEEMLAAGELPHLRALMSDRPSVRTRAVGTFPSATAPAIPEILTGSWSNQLGGAPEKIHAFDRQERRLERYELEPELWDGPLHTLFDWVGLKGGSTLSIFEGTFYGADETVHADVYYLLDIVENKETRVDLLDYDRRTMRDLERRIQRSDRPPNLVFLRFSAVDLQGHFFGPSSELYREALRATDARVGELMVLLRAARLPDGSSVADRAHFVIFGDHGMADADRTVDLDALLRRVGLDPMPTSDVSSMVSTVVNPKGVDDHDVLALPGGSNIAEIYLRSRDGEHLAPWTKRPADGQLRSWPMPDGPVDLVGTLLANDGVDQVFYAEGPNRFRVLTASSGATVLRRYRPDGGWDLALVPDSPGQDPFGYCAGELAELCCDSADDTCFHSAEDWQDATWDQTVPYAPVFVAKAFSGEVAKRADLLVTARPGVGFMAQMKGNHGSLTPECTHTLLAFAGPDVDSKADLRGAKLLDIYPTVLGLLGLNDALEAQPGDGRALPIIRPFVADGTR